MHHHKWKTLLILYARQPMEDHRGGDQVPTKGPIELKENSKMDAKVRKTNHPMLPSAGIYALNPQPSHIALLIATISIRILQCLLHSLPGCPDAVLAATSEPLRQLQYLLVVHCDRCAFVSASFLALLGRWKTPNPKRYTRLPPPLSINSTRLSSHLRYGKYFWLHTKDTFHINEVSGDLNCLLTASILTKPLRSAQNPKPCNSVRFRPSSSMIHVDAYFIHYTK